MRIGICAGHSNHPNPDYRGVVCGDLEEWELCRETVNELRLLLMDAGLEVYDPLSDMRREPYPEYLNHRIDAFNAEGVDAVVAVHLNAIVPGVMSGDTDYVTMLYAPEDAEGARLAATLADSCVRELGGSVPMSRGPWVGTDVAYRGEDKPAGIVRRTRMPAVIAEPMFLSNPEVQRLARYERKQLVATTALAISNGTVAWAEDFEARMAVVEAIEGDA